MRMLSLLTVCTMWSFMAIAQQETAVRDATGTVLPNAWAGGMNACQYGAVDIDLDGNDDLVVFDRTGNRIMTFTWAGGEDYLFAPEYKQYFPELFDWAVIVDYDGDGKKDIFTYSPGYASMMVYRNNSGASLSFERVVYPFLTSLQGGGYVNILVTYADYPGFYDLDGDGDLDILTFWGLGAFVELHKNMSMEKYGHADSLDYEQVDFCWGRFAESEESNEITLDTCFGGGVLSDQAALPHTGSTFLPDDMNGDGIVDLVLGDVDYPNLICLTNGGTGMDAEMILQDPSFPSGTVPVGLYSMPAAVPLDVNHDGFNDLLVSPFDPNPYVVQNKKSNWYYRNDGTSSPGYALVQKDFLQEGMIDAGSGAFPVLHDYDLDGLPDLFVGNYGYYDSSFLDQNLILRSYYTSKLALFRNTGTAQQPAFSLVSDDFAGLSSMDLIGIYPAFADIDDDGDADMVTGINDGTLLYFENVADPGGSMDLVFREKWESVDVGFFSAPAFADLDNDGFTDMVIGEMGGNLNYYRNSGIPGTFALEFITDSLGKVNVTDYNVSLTGFSRPSFFTHNNGKLGLLVGSEQGKVYQFKDIEDNLEGKFPETDSLFSTLSEPYESPDRGFQTSAAAGHLRDNSELDLIIGNFSGGLEYFTNGDIPGTDLAVGEKHKGSDVIIAPNPASGVLVVSAAKENGTVIRRVELLDLHGRMVAVHDRSEDHMIMDVSDIENGTYLCRVLIREMSGEYLISRKVIIMKH